MIILLLKDLVDLEVQEGKMMDNRTIYENFIGKIVCGKTVFAIGDCHPSFPDLVYPINFGTVDISNIQMDAYLIGIDTPVEEFKGRIIAVLKSEEKIGDKLVVSIGNRNYTDEEIKGCINFRERFFDYEIIR